ncbi:unconventional myosin-VIIb-like isoform X2 [Cyprinus carpio]|uniref:Unconventional myosin-VIIb-like isoform X2 n=1 Tax=Cyprinus carpio TaxID=7962 RepID=A0A9Q9VZK7_CYPCA|nr:unconventional myosin-VIIb-like isoform X2 [Cyprinus carpio]
MVMLKKGDHFWIDSSIGVPIGGYVKVSASGQFCLIDDEGKERCIPEGEKASLKPMHPTSVEGVDDMIRLGDLSEAGLLRNLLVRHKQGSIYTYVGSVLVAMNPYQMLPIYTAEQVDLYHRRKLGELPPHIFAIADSCYYNMRRKNRNQCCIISGESGAGKTESTKLILQFLAAVSGQHSWVEQQIIQANPVLEAFGNAKTIRNDNSSRFGKYVEIFFNKEGAIEGAHMEQYLLEKSRVCHQAPQERNYHIFYCMLSGMPSDHKKTLSLGDASQFKYLSEGNCLTCDGRDDTEEFGRIRSALKILTFSDRDCWEIFKLLAAILHMGNIDFQSTIMNNMDSSDVMSSSHFSVTAKLLEVDDAVLEKSLTHRSFMTNREIVTKPLSSEKAIHTRDAFAKAIYGRLFVWMFTKINSAIHKPQTDKPTYTRKSIGLLDIFGFENFRQNSFEQLCINYANEHLQQFFVRHIFKLEQDEYSKEGISWKHIAFNDNQKILDLLAVKPLNILALIDEESTFPKGTDATMLNKMNKEHNGNKLYMSSKSNHGMQFGVKHFAGTVYYDCEGFLEKNRDSLSMDIMELFKKSSNKMLKLIFEKDTNTNSVKNNNNINLMMPKNSLQQVIGDSRRQISTLSGQFRHSLDSLMKALSLCQPFFIRCFKPNDKKMPMVPIHITIITYFILCSHQNYNQIVLSLFPAFQVFNRELCMQQLRYSGMLETIKIRKLGYPIRHTFRDFLQRYRVLLKTVHCDPNTEPAANCCAAICRAMIRDEEDWKIGKAKVFLRDHHDSFLELEREQELYRKALIIQRVMLAHKDRANFVKKRRAALVLQKNWRGHRDRRDFCKLKQGFARLQAKVRSRQLHTEYMRRRAAAITLQTQTRGYLARKDLKHKKDAVILLQAQTRGLLARKTLKKMKTDAFLTAQEKEAQERTALELQQRLEELLRKNEEAAKSQVKDDEEMVENIFGFLPSAIVGQEGPAPEGFEDLEAEPVKLEEVELVESPVRERKVMLLPDSSEDNQDEEDEDEKEKEKQMQNEKKKEKEMEMEKEKEMEREKEEKEKDKESDEFSFSKFASLYFQGSSSPSHIQQRLRQPLLYHEDEGDALACLTVWWIILRFMGDLPEPKQERASAIADPIQMNLGQRQARRLSNLVGLDQKFLRKKMKQQKGTGKRKHSAIPEEEPEEEPQPKMQTVQEEEDVLFGERATYDRPMTPLEKLHIIVGYAIVRQDIRDEIYCQILKQLTANKNPKSTNRGWILLSICLGIFPPTDRLTKYLQSFIHYGPSEYSSYCSERLRRTLANGERSEPPCWVELQSVENKKPITVAVSLMDGRSITLTLDSARTSAEMCNSIIQKINLQDSYGFSLYVAMYEKIWSLGSGGQHVLDTVSICEQDEKRQGREEQHAPWRLYFRKEIFTPWHDCSSDQVSTELIYRQIIHGLKSGDYQSDKEDDYVQLAAKHYYVQHGSESSMETTEKIVRECVSMTLIENKSMVKLMQMIHSAHTQGPYINSSKPAYEVKAETVEYAREKWPIYFSKFYEAQIVSGPSVPQDQFVVVVNWKGVFFQDVTEAAFLQLSYPEVSSIEMSEEKSSGIVCLMTPKGMYELKAVKGRELVELVNMFISGLKKRSVYAVAIQDLIRQEDPTLLNYRRGDVLFMIKDGEYSSEEGWIKARNERTNQTGAVSLDAIRILPMLTRPTEETLNLLNLTPARRKSVMPVLPQKEELSTEKVAVVTLKEFSFDYFRDSKEGGRGKGGAKEKLWANSKEPLKQPLLRSLQGNSELCHLACDCFTAILKYMGDYPVKHVRTPIDLTNQIFGPATAHVELRDEIYCQIMKQMSNNSHGLSMERGWQLLWLCCGLFPPSQLLLRFAQRFLESRPREPLASNCLQRMQAMLSIEGRKLPPHQVEVDAIQNNSTQIFHKVHFPNDTSELFEVTSTTRIKDLCRNIAKDLQLSSSDGYSLFVKTSTKVVGMDSKEYFFDNLRQLTDVIKKGKKVKEAAPTIAPYLVLFMRKLWFNVIPGKDLTADLNFHFPQELPKYLRGYHSVSKEDMISLAGLLLRIQVDTDKSQFVMIPRMLKDLVPADQQKLMTADDWKKHIINAYNKQAGITVDEAKLQFLKMISQWPTFGCVFFEVKQTSEKSYPSVITLSVSKQGVSIINPKTKEVLAMHLFSKITSWSSGNTYFHLTIGSLVQGNTLLCETSMGYRISDLLSSYKDMYLNEIPKVRKSRRINI